MLIHKSLLNFNRTYLAIKHLVSQTLKKQKVNRLLNLDEQ